MRLALAVAVVELIYSAIASAVVGQSVGALDAQLWASLASKLSGLS